jgi:hypothetical protein
MPNDVNILTDRQLPDPTGGFTGQGAQEDSQPGTGAGVTIRGPTNLHVQFQIRDARVHVPDYIVFGHELCGHALDAI